MITVGVTDTNVIVTLCGSRPEIRHRLYLSLGYARLHSLLLVHRNCTRLVHGAWLTDLEVAVIARDVPMVRRLMAQKGAWCPQSWAYRRHVLRLATPGQEPRVAFTQRLAPAPVVLHRLLATAVFVRWAPETHRRFSAAVRDRVLLLHLIWNRRPALPRELEIFLLTFVPD